MAPPALARRAWKFRLSLARAEAETGAKGLVRLLKRLVEVFVGALFTRVFTRVKENRGRVSKTRLRAQHSKKLLNQCLIGVRSKNAFGVCLRVNICCL